MVVLNTAQSRSMALALTIGLATAPGLGRTSEAVVDRQAPLAAAGDADRGRAVFLDRQSAHCLLCHQLSSVDEGFQGTLGPSLDGVAQRLTAAQLRYRIVDPTRLNPGTIMPAYHRLNGLNDVAPAYRNRPVLTAQAVEDLVAFLGEAGR
ncbi:MAG: sulfur oxidation c-type cytochrome SoxX [Pseudomonadota bacterium]